MNKQNDGRNQGHHSVLTLFEVIFIAWSANIFVYNQKINNEPMLLTSYACIKMTKKKASVEVP